MALCIRRPADGLCHLFGRRRKVTRIRRDPCERQVANPVVRILLRNLGIKLEGAFGIPLPWMLGVT